MEDLTFDFTPNVYTCNKDEKIEKIISHMKENKFGSVIIVDGKKPIGIFTERDFLTKVGFQQSEYTGKPISEFMTSSPKTCYANSSLVDVLQTMHLGKFRHIVVVNKEGELEGVASIKDLFASLLGHMKKPDMDLDFMQKFFSMIPDEITL